MRAYRAGDITVGLSDYILWAMKKSDNLTLKKIDTCCKFVTPVLTVVLLCTCEISSFVKHQSSTDFEINGT